MWGEIYDLAPHLGERVTNEWKEKVGGERVTNEERQKEDLLYHDTIMMNMILDFYY